MKRGGGKQDVVYQVKNNLFCGLVLFMEGNTGQNCY